MGTDKADGLDSCFLMVKDFQIKFDNPTSENPTTLSSERRRVCCEYMMEEIQELLEAEAIEDQPDALTDLIYFVLSGMVEIGVTPQPIFEIVHNANMGKLHKDGKPHHDPINGKVVKPETWKDPKYDILDVINNQRRMGRLDSSNSKSSTDF